MRTSDNIFDASGALVSGYDYDLQLWVKGYIVQRCGHPENFACNCLGRCYSGQDIRDIKKEVKP